MNFKKHLLFLTIISIMVSCANDSDDSNFVIVEDTNVEVQQGEEYSFITYVNENNGSEVVEINYSNALLESYTDEVETYNFNLDSENKIISGSKDFVSSEFTYAYSNNKLDSINYVFTSNYELTESYNYDSNENITSIIFEPELYESNFYTYNSDNELVSQQIGTDGTIYTFEFDDKVNPFYALWKKYSLNLDSELIVYDFVPFFAKHNPIKIYSDGNLIIEAEYTYDSEGYPLTCSFTTTTNSGNINFTY